MAFNAKELIGRHYGRLKNAGTAMKPALATAGSKLGAGVARTGTGVANVAGAATGWAGAKANAVGSAVSGAAFAGGAMAAKGIFSWLAGAIIPRTKREKFITFACLLWALDFFTDFNTSIIYVLLTGLVMSYYAITNLYGLSSGSLFFRAFWFYWIAGFLLKIISRTGVVIFSRIRMPGEFETMISYFALISAIFIYFMVRRIFDWKLGKEFDSNELKSYLGVALVFSLHLGGMEALNQLFSNMFNLTRVWTITTIILPPWVLLGIMTPEQEEHRCWIPGMATFLIFFVFIRSVLYDIFGYDIWKAMRFQVGTTEPEKEIARKNLGEAVTVWFKTAYAGMACTLKGMFSSTSVTTDENGAIVQAFDRQLCIDKIIGIDPVEEEARRRLEEGIVDPNRIEDESVIKVKAAKDRPVYRSGMPEVGVTVRVLIEDNDDSYAFRTSCQLGSKNSINIVPGRADPEVLMITADDSRINEEVTCYFSGQDYLQHVAEGGDKRAIVKLSSEGLFKESKSVYWAFFMDDTALKNKRESFEEDEDNDILLKSIYAKELDKDKENNELFSEVFPDEVDLIFGSHEITDFTSDGAMKVRTKLSGGAFVGIGGDGPELKILVENNAPGSISKAGQTCDRYQMELCENYIELPNWLEPDEDHCGIVDWDEDPIIENPRPAKVRYPLRPIPFDYRTIDQAESEELGRCKLKFYYSNAATTPGFEEDPTKLLPVDIITKLEYDYEFVVEQTIMRASPSGDYRGQCAFVPVNDPMTVLAEEPCLSENDISQIFTVAGITDSELLNSADDIWEIFDDADIDASFGIGMFKHESGNFNPTKVAMRTKNPGNIKCDGDVREDPNLRCNSCEVVERVDKPDLRFCKFPRWEDGFYAMAYMFENYNNFIKAGRDTVDKIIPVWLGDTIGASCSNVGQGDGYDEDSNSCNNYVDNVKNTMNCLHANAGTMFYDCNLG